MLEAKIYVASRFAGALQLQGVEACVTNSRKPCILASMIRDPKYTHHNLNIHPAEKAAAFLCSHNDANYYAAPRMIVLPDSN